MYSFLYPLYFILCYTSCIHSYAVMALTTLMAKYMVQDTQDSIISI